MIMASEPIRRDEKKVLPKDQQIPRVISMSVGAGPSKSAPMPLPAVSRNPSIAHVTKGGLVANSISAPAVASGASFQLPKKANKPSSVADTRESGSSGRWTASEHEAFLEGLKLYGREWKKVSQCIPTRTAAQIRSHAQKYFNKVSKDRQETMELEPTRSSCPADLALKSDPSKQLSTAELPAMSRSYHDFVKAISADPSSAESKVNSVLRSLHKRKTELESRLRKIKSDEVPKIFTSDLSGTTSMGPASAALQLEQQNLREAAKARYELKRRSRTPSPKESTSHNMGSKNCPSVSLATMPSSGDFDSGEVLALSLRGTSLIQNKLQERPSKSRKTEH